VLSAFADEPYAVCLLSDGEGERGRWSYLARNPSATLTIAAGDPTDAFAALRALIGPAGRVDPDGPPFQGGVIGLAGYELGDRVERLGLGRMVGWPDLVCGRYETLLAFDHHRREVLAIGHGAADALSWLQAPPAPTSPGPLAADLQTPDPALHEAAVAAVVARIGAGEIFQANLARSWTGRLVPGRRPIDLFLRLAGASVAPFAAYLRLPGLALVSNSPERFLRVTPSGEALIAETRPIKGTVPRGATPDEDARLVAALAASEKDRAENLMIVDLMRNDLARVSIPGTVRVPALFAIERFANVSHLVSTVTATLASGKDAVDLLAAAFPPGSITGAPKVQAMKVIAELEPPRGPFFGAMFWAGFDGAFDSNVLIRTAAFAQDGEAWRFEARAGGGIVADSDPVAERLETEAKIAAVLAALQGA
jgi:para-aminobenzoate synthetase component 1